MNVSVIIPVRNDAIRLERCLASISRLSVPVEVVVVDNGSSDNSASVARTSGALVLVEPTLRVGALRNRGVASSGGEVLAFVDSDHEVPSDWIENGLMVLRSNPNVVAVGAVCQPPVDGTWVQDIWAIHRMRGPQRSEVDWLGSGNLMIRRSEFLKVAGFREDLVAAEDVDLCYRLRANGGKIIQDKRIQNIHHGEPRTIWEFVKKEYWRGSSGLKAWFSQGCPSRDIPNLVWPLWFGGLGAVLVVVQMIVLCVYLLNSFGLLPEASTFGPPGIQKSLFFSITTLVLWFFPALVLSVKVCWSENRTRDFFLLALLYVAFGIARFAAIARGR